MPSRTIWDGRACFTTHVVHDHTPIFCHHNYFSVICDSLTWCRHHAGLKVYGFVIMPDHVHLLSAADNSAALQDTLARFRRFTALELLKRLKWDKVEWAMNALNSSESGQSLWESGFYPVDASRADIFDQKLEYLHENPVRRGFVKEAQDWAYSSARNYWKKDWHAMEIDFPE